MRDQRLDVESQRLVAVTRFAQKRGPLVRFALERRAQKTVDEGPPFVVHEVVLACPEACRAGTDLDDEAGGGFAPLQESRGDVEADILAKSPRLRGR